ncbi:hypothetical protein C4552_04070 [Candidatus Parcubacteria bacterium]|nr:MAG: hypothetical protein C4552_04070 [Candidatus Parcubacteria bacterium]
MEHTLIKSSVSIVALAVCIGPMLVLPVGVMGMAHDGAPMINCPFMFGEKAICTMPAFEHISLWQALMTAIPPGIPVLALLAFAAARLFLRRTCDPPDPPRPRIFVPEGFLRDSLFSTLLLETATSPRAP